MVCRKLKQMESNPNEFALRQAHTSSISKEEIIKKAQDDYERSGFVNTITYLQKISLIMMPKHIADVFRDTLVDLRTMYGTGNLDNEVTRLGLIYNDASILDVPQEPVEDSQNI
uniref:PHB domain-containing protein n=1 Tax=Rhabditophanes sp. KR3021 TaxID=114890 RepID=A0AC35UBH0_9BILA